MTKPEHLPDHLSGIWDELHAQVKGSIGAAGLEALCAQVYRLRDAQQRITEDGLLVANDKMQPVEHPAMAIERAAQKEIREWFRVFGRSSGA